MKLFCIFSAQMLEKVLEIKSKSVRKVIAICIQNYIQNILKHHYLSDYKDGVFFCINSVVNPFTAGTQRVGVDNAEKTEYIIEKRGIPIIQELEYPLIALNTNLIRLFQNDLTGCLLYKSLKHLQQKLQPHH